MKRLRMLIGLLVRRGDLRTHRVRAARITQRSARLLADNRAVLDDIRRMERGIQDR